MFGQISFKVPVKGRNCIEFWITSEYVLLLEHHLIMEANLTREW